MENDRLRRQITEEIQAEFEAKVRQVKRLKENAEGELETAAERWRTEKRRLNAEIDRLEAALVDAKATAARKRPAADTDGTPQALEAATLARLQETADEKLKK